MVEPRSQEFLDLVRRVRRETSPVERLRLVARAFRRLRTMEPAERSALADEIGVEGADRFLEGLATKRGGVPVAAMLRALSGVRGEGIDTAGLVEQLRTPVGRRALAERGLEALQGAVEPEAGGSPGPEPEPEVGAAAPSPDTPRAAASRRAEPGAGPAGPPREPGLPRAVSVPPDEPTPRSAPPVLPVREESAAHPIVRRPAPSPPPPSGPPGFPASAETPPRARAGEGATTPPESPAAARPLRERRPEVALAAAVAEAGTIAGRFRVLRRDADALAGLDTAAWLDAIEAFPDGWERRRAVQTAIRCGAARDLATAWSILERLERPTDRVWCAAELLESGVLTHEERLALVERTGSPRLARRLSRRSARV